MKAFHCHEMQIGKDSFRSNNLTSYLIPFYGVLFWADQYWLVILHLAVVRVEACLSCGWAHSTYIKRSASAICQLYFSVLTLELPEFMIMVSNAGIQLILFVPLSMHSIWNATSEGSRTQLLQLHSVKFLSSYSYVQKVDFVMCVCEWELIWLLHTVVCGNVAFLHSASQSSGQWLYLMQHVLHTQEQFDFSLPEQQDVFL